MSIFSWKTKYEKFLELENTRLRNEYRIMLAAFLEHSGARKTAELMFDKTENQAAPMIAKLRKPSPEPAGAGWRGIREAIEQKTMPTGAKDSADKLTERVEGATNGR